MKKGDKSFDEKKDSDFNKERNYLSVKHNTLARARFNFTAMEKKIIEFAVSKITPQDIAPKGENRGVRVNFTISEYCEIFDIKNSGRNYNHIREAARSVRNKGVWVKINPESNKQAVVSYFQDVIADEGTGEISVEFHYRLTPFIQGLNIDAGNLTMFKLFNISKLKSQYSLRLYEYFKSVDHVEQPFRITIEELKHILIAEHFKEFAQFRRKIIEVAVGKALESGKDGGGEINEKTDLNIKWEPKKIKSSKYNQIWFWIKEKNQIEVLELEYKECLGTNPERAQILEKIISALKKKNENK